jgi:hypothetical protein
LVIRRQYETKINLFTSSYFIASIVKVNYTIDITRDYSSSSSLSAVENEISKNDILYFIAEYSKSLLWDLWHIYYTTVVIMLGITIL